MWKAIWKNREKVIFAAYVILYLVFALTITFYQPLTDNPFHTNPPDEHARILIPNYILEHGSIPTGLEEEVRIPSYGFSYGLYNAAPYYLQGAAMRLVSVFTSSPAALLYAGRLVNVFFGLCMSVVVYCISKKVFEDEGKRWLFCFAVTFLPQNLFIHTYINTDSCCMLSVAIILYALICGYRTGFTRKNELLLAIGVILCALSYYNAYGYILCSVVLFCGYFWKKENQRIQYDYKRMLKGFAFISIIVLAGAGWFFVRSGLLFDGDILGLTTRTEMAAKYASPEVNPLTMQTYQDRGYTMFGMIKETNMLNAVYTSFIGEFGSMSITGSRFMYRFYKAFFAVGLIGTVCGIVRSFGEKKERKWQSVFFHANMAVCMAIPVFLLFYYAFTMDYQAQGRYMLPSMPPLMLYTVYGTGFLVDRLKKIRKFPKWLPVTVYVPGIVIILFWTGQMIYKYALPLYLMTTVV